MMGSDVPDPVFHEDREPVEDTVDGSLPNQKKHGNVPKGIKSEREKLKREQLNEHFNRLACVLELSDPNYGKASILSETIQFVNDMVSQVQSLRSENTTLLSEFHDLAVEKNDLKDENRALESQIKKINSGLEERLLQSKPDLNVAPPESWQVEMNPHFMEGCLQQLPTVDPSTQQPPLGPIYVIPFAADLQTSQKDDTASNPPVAVTKPHARYPTPADSWPLHLMSKQPESAS